MNRVCRIPLLVTATAMLGLALAGPVAAQLPFGVFAPGSQFELSDTVQLDRADGTVLAQLERVKAQLADRQWDEAVETLRQMMENSEGKLLGVTEHRFVSLGDYCQLQLAALPPEALKLYRGRVDPVARKWYEDGVARRDRKLLTNVIHQAFASSWGDKALLALGDLALESGDFTTARWHWERILPTQPPPGMASTWPGFPGTKLDPAAVRARLVLVSILEGLPARARDELAQLTRLHPDARGRIAGREVNYAQFLRETLAQSVTWPPSKPGRDWPIFAGTAARDGVSPEMVEVGHVAWRVPLPRTAGTPGEGRPTAVAEDAMAPLSYHPLVVGNRVLVGTQREILGVRLATGKPIWGEAGPAIYRDQLEGVAAAGAIPPETLGTPRFTMTVRDGRLYARNWAAQSPAARSSPAAAMPGGPLVCLDLEAEGTLLWKTAPEEGWAFEGAPVVDGSGVFVAMRRSDIRPQAHVACFDAQTGRLRWRRFVCAAETPARGMFYQTTHNLLTLQGDRLYYNTNLGAVAALSTDQGRVLWISLYPRARKGNVLKLTPHWQRDLNPCLAHHGTLLVAPADSPRIFCLDAGTGQILWQTGTEVEDVVHLLGVAGDQLIASGGKLYWIGLKDETRGRITHVWPDGQEKPGFGRGTLAAQNVLFPTRDKIHVFDQITGQPKKAIPLGPLGARGGNLLSAGGRLLIATGTELIALDRGGAAPKETSTELTSTHPEP